MTTSNTKTTVRFISAYVVYKNETYLIADVRDLKLLIIAKDGTKLQVLKSSVKVYPHWRVAEVEYQHATYWVTRQNNILSTVSHKWVWASKSKVRTGILELSSAAWEAKGASK